MVSVFKDSILDVIYLMTQRIQETFKENHGTSKFSNYLTARTCFGESGGDIGDALSPISFIFMQFSAIFCSNKKAYWMRTNGP